MDSGRRKGPICGVENCRSRVYDEGEDGYRYCENGHRKGDLVVGLDEDNFTSEARVRTRKKKDRGDDEKEYKYLKGQEAYDLYLKSLQLIIRHQVWFLVHEKGLPAELEYVVLDLWTLRILQLEKKVSNEGHEYDSQSQAFNTSESDNEVEMEVYKSMRGKKLNATPTLRDSLALCYLGIITLRLPVTLGDIYKWVMDGKMAYKRAIKHVPPAMRDRLPASYHAALDPNATLKLKRLHSTIIDLQVSFEREHRIIWPNLNYPLLLFRYLKELALPLELYDATIRLAALLGYDFSLHTLGKVKLGVRHVPEAQLVACLVVCIKLMYPFDGERRYPRTSSEPAVTVINWDEWYKEVISRRMDKGDGIPKLTMEELTNTSEKDVLSMTAGQMDQYLDWYQEMFIDDSKTGQDENGDFRNALYSMFPIDGSSSSDPATEKSEGLDGQEQLDIVKAVHGSLRSEKIIREGEEKQGTVRPGQGYLHYKKEKDLPESARSFYIEAARIAGLSLDMLVMAVFFVEKAIDKWRNQQRQLSKRDAEA
ncbi:hypothetical protein K505DRAFT_299185 [Melanomma pulvis-pyrius CBS 109.77]|uniref:RRN7-type domain-containing protein n=1 Tax=Melanomma pulvis-pyrius CBS 109.77 TaxID=1314802 RepID=A0A6A6XN46_9PLEO|nr:hypothetical protein K505DRAFT_299185 [Melanomma pulvis-pyrius CBS 109.77]